MTDTLLVCKIDAWDSLFLSLTQWMQTDINKTMDLLKRRMWEVLLTAFNVLRSILAAYGTHLPSLTMTTFQEVYRGQSSPRGMRSSWEGVTLVTVICRSVILYQLFYTKRQELGLIIYFKILFNTAISSEVAFVVLCKLYPLLKSRRGVWFWNILQWLGGVKAPWWSCNIWGKLFTTGVSFLFVFTRIE